MSQSAVWALIWLAAAAAFGIGEMLMAGSFFLLPFAAGAVLAAVVATLAASPFWSWLAFIVGSVAAFAGMRPFAQRLQDSAPDVAGIGANRLVGAIGVVLAPISATPGVAGMVKVGTEEWRADTPPGIALSAGTKVRVVEVLGTRLLVEPTPIEDLG
ncbi:MAG: NfeD family protein [Acidimicrobiia bacterium]|nr:NfeD family protein [Acidimicrobiia bacterium]MDH5521131.1 NfeD family protein [Acidimicrobiia bacterium]